MGISVPEIVGHIKRSLSGDLYLVLILLFVGTASFGLGRLSAIEAYREPVRVESAPAAAASVEHERPDEAAGSLVASKNGSRYHFPWCSSAARIKEENKVWFTSRDAAKQAGYTPAANCKGL